MDNVEAVPETPVEKSCQTCAFDGFDLPRCKECYSANDFMMWVEDKEEDDV